MHAWLDFGQSYVSKNHRQTVRHRRSGTKASATEIMAEKPQNIVDTSPYAPKGLSQRCVARYKQQTHQQKKTKKSYWNTINVLDSEWIFKYFFLTCKNWIWFVVWFLNAYLICHVQSFQEKLSKHACEITSKPFHAYKIILIKNADLKFHCVNVRLENFRCFI